MKTAWLSLLLAAGPGTELSHDAGYWTHPEGQPGRRYVPLPKVVVVLGHEDAAEAKILRRDGRQMLVCVEKNDYPPYDAYYLIPRSSLRWRDVRKLKLGPTVEVEANVGIRK